MIRHIVMFKLREFGSETEKTNAAQEVKLQLDKLPEQINLIRKFEVATDMRRLQWSFDVVLIMDFDDMAALEAYTIHPAHKEFIVFNKDYSVEKVCIDYEIAI